ncbi:MAG: RidA family protein [Rhizobiales bacterium]|nr:RidA family protein [Hyphomicrobiales bacterium]
MPKYVDSPLAPPNVPLNWAVTAPVGEIFYAAHLSIGPNGTFVNGTIEEQTRQTMENIKGSIQAAGGTMADIAQCLVYLTDASEADGMNRAYGEYFKQPYPNRATVVVSALLIPEAKVEIVACAHLAGQ